MRITTNMYYKNVYSTNNTTLNNAMFDVNKQIASGLKIQYAKDDVRTFSETMRLDNEIVVLEQIKSSTQSAFKVSDQIDTVLGEFETAINRTRTLLINASNNGTHSELSLDAIAQELRAVETHFKNLANSSIDGKYLFSGSAVDIRPISDDGEYMGNGELLKAFTGSRTSQQYNISGEELFLGEKKLVRREITANVVQLNLSTKYPDFTDPTLVENPSMLSVDDTIRDLMGDTDNIADTVEKHFFYVRGTKSDGTAFQKQIKMTDTDKIQDLLNEIGNLYGNTPNLKAVNVTLNDYGEIVIEDKIKGSSKIDFHMVGAVDFSGGIAADVTDIDLLDGGETNFDEIINPSVPPANNLYVKEFIKSGFLPANGAAANIEGLLYDRTQFQKDGAEIYSSDSQIVIETNAFATGSTKLSEVASGGTLDGKSFVLDGVNIYGVPYNATIDFSNAGSTFSLDGGVTNYDIFDIGVTRSAVGADDMTYKQFMDVINMVVTGSIPASTNVAADYDNAIESADLSGATYLTHDGKIKFEEIDTGNTQATISLYDSNSGDFSAPASVMRFNSNNSIAIRDPKTDFFKTFSEMITAVENYKLYPDSTSSDVRNVGIENAVAMMDDLQDHIFRIHSQVGAQSNALSTSLERTELLQISSMTLRSSVIDTDLAEASLTLTQLSLNYEAMLSMVGKVSKLNLLNYL